MPAAPEPNVGANPSVQSPRSTPTLQQRPVSQPNAQSAVNEPAASDSGDGMSRPMKIALIALPAVTILIGAILIWSYEKSRKEACRQEVRQVIEQNNIPEAVRKLKAYLSDENATKASEAKKLLAEIELATSQNAALDTLVAIGEEDFRRFQKLRHWNDGRVGHPVLIAIWDSNLVLVIPEAEKKRKEAKARRLAELKKREEEEQAAEAEKLKKKLMVDLGSGVKMEMVLIPAGEFIMGNEDGDDSEKPVHKVRFSKPFCLGKYEVTQEQWEAVMGNNPSDCKGARNPVERVNLDDCRKFLEKLNAKVGGGKFSLPTEAQWEYACRAGSMTKYCYGDDEGKLGEYAWYKDNSDGKTHPVGEKKPNAWGLYDMHGNVSEWCSDRYSEGYYAESPVEDPRGPVAMDDPNSPVTGSYRVFRGGGWHDHAGNCRSTVRYFYLVTGFRSLCTGLRVARVPTE